MDYKIKYTNEAIAELNKGYIWYRSKEIEFGQKFKDVFNKIRIELKDNPKIFREVGTNHRRAVLGSSFPYRIHYLIDEKTKTIKIIGVFHQSKDIKLVNEKIKIRKIHQLIQDKKQKRYLERMKDLEQTRINNSLEQDRERDLGLEH